jgi:hypothetical protein
LHYYYIMWYYMIPHDIRCILDFPMAISSPGPQFAAPECGGDLVAAPGAALPRNPFLPSLHKKSDPNGSLPFGRAKPGPPRRRRSACFRRCSVFFPGRVSRRHAPRFQTRHEAARSAEFFLSSEDSCWPSSYPRFHDREHQASRRFFLGSP